MTIQELAREYKPKLDTIPGMRMYIQIPPSIQIGGRSTKSQYQYTLESPDATRFIETRGSSRPGWKNCPASST